MNDRNVGEHRLTLAEVLDWMVEDSLVDRARPMP
jgi:general secretion pathway protein E